MDDWQVDGCEGQRIGIADGVSILIVQIKGNRVRLGVECPDGVSVNRKEVEDLLTAQERNP